jgi:hypothetical protein
MNAGKTTGLMKTAALFATTMLSASFALAGPSVSSPEMKTALAKAREGSTELRRYVERTKPIYNLDYFEVMSAYDAVQSASGDDVAATNVAAK